MCSKLLASLSPFWAMVRSTLVPNVRLHGMEALSCLPEALGTLVAAQIAASALRVLMRAEGWETRGKGGSDTALFNETGSIARLALVSRATLSRVRASPAT